MGYSTKFEGELRFTSELTASQLAELKSMCGEDCRDHPEWNMEDLYYIDLELTDNFSGLRWNGAEKTYDLDKLVNVVLVEMRKKWPDFGLTGTLTAQGEDIEDRWTLTIGEDGMAHKMDIIVINDLPGAEVICSVHTCKFNDDPACTAHTTTEPIRIVPNGNGGAMCLKFEVRRVDVHL